IPLLPLHAVTQGGVGPADGGPGGGASDAESVVSCPLGVMHTSSPSGISLRAPLNDCIEALPLITFTRSTHRTSCGGFPFRRGSTVTSMTAPALVEIGCAFASSAGMARKASVSNAGMYALATLSSSFQSRFEPVIQNYLAQYLYVRPALYRLSVNSVNGASTV